MARINIEECWWTDPRREQLATLVGGIYVADGAALRMWRLAQEFWKNGRQLVPQRIFDSLQFATALLQSGLAELRGDVIYVRGSSQYLEWVNERRLAASEGGKKSGETRRNKSPKAPKQPKANGNQNEAKGSKPKQTQPSVSGSISDSGSNEIMNPSDSCAEAQAGENPPGGNDENPGDPPNACQVFIGTYAKAYEAKYHFRPEVVLAEAGAAKNIVKALGLQKALLFIPTYLSMTDSWFLTKRHSLCAMVSNLNAIKQFHQTGKVTSINANGGRKKTAFERDEDIDAEMQKLLSGEAAHG